jgi:probable F420-dependent oxidoreductase
MRFAFELPTFRVDRPDEFVTGEAVAEIARGAQACGFQGLHVSDHPAPDARWLDHHGGHHALDPFVALSFAAAATTSLKLMTNIYVAAYRNPFLGAKSILSLDLLSGGRLIVGTGVGYLKPEFDALGVDYSRRGAIFDDALDVIVRSLSGDAVQAEGTTYRARGVRMRPSPISRPHPAIWIGGNSKAALRRAVERFQGWAPFDTMSVGLPPGAAAISAVSDIEAGMAWARTHSAKVGRTEPLDVCLSIDGLLESCASDDERQDLVGRLERAGVTWMAIRATGEDRKEVIDRMRAFSAVFIPQ